MINLLNNGQFWIYIELIISSSKITTDHLYFVVVARGFK